MYKPITQEKKLKIGKGTVAIVTGWLPVTKLTEKIDCEDYAVIGNLYSPQRGISCLIRNLLANPFVSTLVILNTTKEDKNSGGSECLLDFFNNGYTKGYSELGKECWLINSKIKGYIDIDITSDALDLLKSRINYFYFYEVKDAIAFINNYKETKKNHDEPLYFPEIEFKPHAIGGEVYGQRVSGKTIAETWVKILHSIKNNGIINTTGDGIKWQELINLIAVVTDEPEEFYFPEPNFLPITRDFFENYKSQMIDNAPYKEGVKYTYGQRLRSWFGQDQVKEVIKKLIKEIDSASAVMSLWDAGSGTPIDNIIVIKEHNEDHYYDSIARPNRLAGDSDHDHSGSPCLNHISVRIINKRLILTATFRSNDMYSAWVANAMGLRELQKHIRDEINQKTDYNLTLGNLITISQSAHIYEDTWDNVDLLVKTKKKQLMKVEYNDKVGNFLIEYNDKIKVSQLNHGEVVKVYEGTNPLLLIREIVFNNPSINPAHAGYLGIELNKAKLLKGDYKQDV